MELDLSSVDPRFAYPIADTLAKWKNGFTPNEMQQQVSEMLNQDASIAIYASTARRPEFLLAQTENTSLVLILGAMDRFIIGNVVEGYLTHRDSRGPTGIHPLALEWANNTYPLFIGQFGNFRDRIIVGGYSWGGACAQALGVQLRQLKPNAIISVVTYGSPRVCDDRGQLSLAGFDLGRWMNAGDGIALTPPPPNKAPIMHALLSSSESENLQQWQQTGEGRVLNADRTIQRSMVPFIQPVWADLRLGNFLLNSQAAIAIEHRIDLYVERLSAWIVANPRVEERIRAVAQEGEEPPMQHRRNQPNPELEMPGAPVGEVQGARIAPWVLPIPIGAAVDAVPPRIASDGPDKPYYYLLENGAHTVCTGEVCVAICSTKRGARSMARTLNQAWNKWNRATAGDADTFAATARENFID